MNLVKLDTGTGVQDVLSCLQSLSGSEKWQASVRAGNDYHLHGAIGGWFS